MRVVLALSLFAALVWGPFTRAQAADVTLTPSADTTVRFSNPNGQSGGNVALDMYYDSGTNVLAAPVDVHESYIKFNLSQIPAGSFVYSAKLELTSYGASETGYADIRIRQVLSDWTEGTTWQTRPNYADSSLANVEVTNNTFPADIDITNLVAAWHNGTAPNYGIVLRPFGDGDYHTGLYTADEAHISSKEGPNPPRLVVVYGPEPPPGPTPGPDTGSGDNQTPGVIIPGSGSHPGSSPTPNDSLSGTNGTGQTDETNQTSTSASGDRIVTQTVRACEKSITDLTIRPSITRADVSFSTAESMVAHMFLYDVTKVPKGSKDNKAQQLPLNSKEMVESAAKTAHSFSLEELQDKHTYFYTVVVGTTQECEHRFVTLFSSSAEQIAAAQKDRDQLGKLGAAGQKSPVRSLAQKTGPLASLSHALKAILTFGHDLSVLDYTAISLWLLVFLTFGSATASLVKRLYARETLVPKKLLRTMQHRNRPGTWGRVLASMPLKPIDRATLYLYDAETNQIVDKTTSDERGFYGFDAQEGAYKVTASHRLYSFPSVVMPRAYKGGTVAVERSTGIIHMDITLDPAELTNPRLQAIERTIFPLLGLHFPLLIVGMVVSMMALIHQPTLLIGGVLVLYGLLAYRAWRARTIGHAQVNFVTTQGQPIALAQVEFRSQRSHAICEVATNNHGQAYLDLSAGQYAVTVTTIDGERVTRHASQPFTMQPSWYLKKVTLTVS